MKSVRTFGVICLMLIASAPVWAQSVQRARGARQGDRVNCALCRTSIEMQPLSEAETAKLLFMREEEKLARDVYQTLYATWGVRIFSRIADSEQRHFDSIGTLIIRYGLIDPAQADAGVFTNPDLQKLYDDLIILGNQSLLEAMNVGVAIEQTDIDDLKAAIAITDNNDLLIVYGNLLNGSLNHLAAFESHVETLSLN